MNFTSNQIAYPPILVIYVFVLIGAIAHWNSEKPIISFDKHFFLYGYIGSFICQISVGFCIRALTIGPAGPVCAIILSGTLIFVVIEAIRNNRVPTWIEFLSLVIGLIGALEMIIPETIKKILFLVFCCKKSESETIRAQNDDEHRNLIDEIKKVDGNKAK